MHYTNIFMYVTTIYTYKYLYSAAVYRVAESDMTEAT